MGRLIIFINFINLILLDCDDFHCNLITFIYGSGNKFVEIQRYRPSDAFESPEVIATFEPAKTSLVHSFSVTEDYFVLFMYPLDADPLVSYFSMERLLLFLVSVFFNSLIVFLWISTVFDIISADLGNHQQEVSCDGSTFLERKHRH